MKRATKAVLQTRSAGHRAIPSAGPALTQVTVKLMICFNPTQIRAGLLKCLMKKCAPTFDLGYFSSDI